MNDGAPQIPSLFTLLESVKRRPGMYVGDVEEDYGIGLDRLEMMINGYLIAIHSHNVTDPGAISYEDFPNYLAQRFGWSMSQGPIRAIRHACSKDETAWDMFWQLLSDYEQLQAFCYPGSQRPPTG